MKQATPPQYALSGYDYIQHKINMMASLIFVVSSLTSPPLNASGSSAQDSEPFIALFTKTCMAHFYAQDTLRLKMIADGARMLLPDDNAPLFLGHTSGAAWVVGFGGMPYVVSLRDDGVCAVFAKHASAAAVKENFTDLVSIAPPPLVSQKEMPAGPNRDDIETISYSWSLPEDKTELLFTLTTSKTENHPIQAMASMALIQKAK
jgi:hypothetical protein